MPTLMRTRTVQLFEGVLEVQEVMTTLSQIKLTCLTTISVVGTESFFY